MGIILGYLCLLSLLLLFIKALSHKFNLDKIDRFLMRIHKYVCALFLILCLFHIILILPVLKTRNPYVYITGIAIIFIFAIVVSVCHFIKNDSILNVRWHRILSTLLFLCVIAHMVTYFIDFRNYQEKIQVIELQEIDTSYITNGQYIGEYDAGYIYAKVQVTILNGRIKDINILEHQNEHGKTAEKIVDNITSRQEFPVDVISGATNSSKVIQQAIQNALSNNDIDK